MSSQEPNAAASVTQIALGVKRVGVGAPFSSHVYLIDGPDGSTPSTPPSRAPVPRRPADGR